MGANSLEEGDAAHDQGPTVLVGVEIGLVFGIGLV